MADRKDFPLTELREAVETLQGELEQAEADFSDDKDLVESIQEAIETAHEVAEKIK